LNPDFWRDRRVFITGHTGFKGSWVCMLLHRLGANVAGYALDPPTQPSLFALARVYELVDSTIGDIRDLDALTRRLTAFKPDVVLHMAAQSVVLASYEDPVENYSTNVVGTASVLEAVRRTGQPCSVVNVTTDKCYENRGWVWGYRETDTLGGRDPYSNSKACAELVGQSFRDSFFPLDKWDEHRVAIASARAGNVIGGGDWTARQLIPELIAAFATDKPVVLRHPGAIRPWQHVLDCLGGYLTLAEGLARDPQTFSGGWNFGPSDVESRTVAEVVEALARHWGVAEPWIRDTVTHAHEERQLRLDVTKAAELLDWRGDLSIDVALEWVARWYLDLRNGRDARELSLAQVDAYLQTASARP
jgi:CDP-glucose 4,6-dehydratase